MSCKKTILLALLSVSTLVEAAPCKVYGISDSPQRTITCEFRKQTVALSCENGRYFLNKFPVKEAYHYEVEEGTVPLVFEAREMTLVLVLDSKITASLESSTGRVSGTCK